MENGKCIFEFPSPVKGLNMLASFSFTAEKACKITTKISNTQIFYHFLLNKMQFCVIL